ncbi:MAG: FG-GAP-like repeat-containing protein, partial [Bacteroidota bacterium]
MLIPLKRYVPFTWHLLFLVLLLFPDLHFSQSLSTSFTDQSSWLPIRGFSGAPIGIADMNGDKKDDLVFIRNRNTLVVQTQDANSQGFSVYDQQGIGSTMWSVCVGDFDQNGRNDILTGGAFTNIRLYNGNVSGTPYTGSVLANSDIFLQGSNFVDIDNDGWLDVFACHDVGDSRKYHNDGAGNLTFDNSLLNTEAPPSDHSGNYASIWTDYDNDGDIDMYLSKCRQGVTDPTDLRRVNMLFQNDGSNTYTEVAVGAGLRLGDQTWGTDFADIDNDGDLDAFVNNHETDCLLLINNGDGTYADATAGSGLLPTLAGSGSLIGIQAIFRDFDNDGFVDLLFSGSSHYLFYNDGDGTFTLAANPSSPLGTVDIHSFAIGDMNHDGFLDIYASHGSGFNTLGSVQDQLFLNQGNAHHFVAIQLTGEESNINAIGARLELYGTWGKQIREVRSGEGYGIMNTFTQHFGLGSATQMDSLIIRWPSGIVNRYDSLDIDQFIHLTEQSDSLHANFTASRTSAYPPPADISFDASTSYLKGSGTLTYDWDMGDGTIQSGRKINHTYTSADSFLVVLTLTESLGGKIDKDSLWIFIGSSIDDFPDLDIDADNDGIPDSVENKVGFQSITSNVLQIRPDGLSDTAWVDLSALGLGIGEQVSLSNLVANGDLNGGDETFTLNFNDGEHVTTSLQTGVQCTGLQPVTTELDVELSLIDIGSGVPGLKVIGTSSAEVDDLVGCSNGIDFRFDAGTKAMLDVDGDGIPNYQDLDSDNDGIWDVVEAGGTDTDEDAFIDNPDDQGTLSTPPNTDGDFLYDFADLESNNPANDGTGIWDMASTSYGYFDTNNDGTISAADTDGGVDNDLDGLDDLLDGNLKAKGSGKIGEHVFVAGHSVARMWNEVLLEAIRGDFARPTVHARNLFHISAAMYDAWSAYEDEALLYFLGNTQHGFNIPFASLPVVVDSVAAQKEAISYAAYRLIRHRFANSPGKNRTLFLAELVMQDLGYPTTVTSTDYQSEGPAALGNYIADRIIAYGLQDQSNEATDYSNSHYNPENNFLEIAVPGNPYLTDPNRWQPLAFDVFIDQSGNITSSNVPDFLSPEWGEVPPFAMDPNKKATFNRDGENYFVYQDPGAPPYLDTTTVGAGTSDAYKWGFSMVATWSAHLDPSDGVMWDISPASIGNLRASAFPDAWNDYASFYDYQDGGAIGSGRTVNPTTGLPYTPQMVPRGDYARVLAEFWADGPDSETPPGHWFTILNYVSDHPDLVKKWRGAGRILSDLEWDIKTYFSLGGTMHDAAIAAWSVKGWYDYIRPVSALRYMAKRGQSSDPGQPSFDPGGIPLVPGRIELISAGDALAGPGNIHVGKIKIYGWRGPNVIIDLNEDVAGVGWI